MSSDLQYGSLLNYSPGGTSEVSIRSRRICGAIKGGDTKLIRQAVGKLAEDDCAELLNLLGDGATLVPVPRSAPLVANALWPSKVIADIIVEEGYADNVSPYLSRAIAVPKSSSVSSDQRPSVQQHYDSLTVDDGDLFSSQKLVLVDDVVTQGRTTYACRQRLSEGYPNAEITVFAVVRAFGFEEVTKILDPIVSVIRYYESSGKTYRDPD